MSIKLVCGYDFKDEIKVLFNEYTNYLVEGDNKFKEYLEIQKYDNEMEHLEDKYGMPYGRLYLAFCENQVAGCIALRKINDTQCEMKRLYVRPEFRGKGIGKTLAQRVVTDAKEIGYEQMLLDTLPFLEKAIKMYKQMGFYKIDCYNNSPMDNSIYFKLDL
ncbi:MAG: GNAT family N-acetyltransferase [Clostridia bacterium]|nr:GNAT family N-acetyltransferase [Clostridia bacterium]